MLFSSDLQYINQRYAHSVKNVGNVQAVKFYGNFYRFDPNLPLESLIDNFQQET